MSKLGKRWEIDGVPAAFITRGAGNGEYQITFERDAATLDQIEGINWAGPALQQLTDSQEELGLPEGYGFQVTDIRYQHGGRYFVAEVKTTSQYLGDVAGYQARIRELEGAVEEQRAAISEQQATIDTQAVTIQTQTQAVEAMTADMENAYAEGVESNG